MSHPPRSNGNAPSRRFFNRRFESWLVDASGGAAAVLAALGFEPPTKKSAVGCITIRSLPILRPIVLPTAWTRVCHLQKTQSVCFCLTDCWPV